MVVKIISDLIGRRNKISKRENVGRVNCKTEDLSTDIGKNAISVGEVDNLVKLIRAWRLGLGNVFLLTLDALDWSLDGLERTSIKRGLTNFFFIEPRCER
jgi:hypothetical protein